MAGAPQVRNHFTVGATQFRVLVIVFIADCRAGRTHCPYRSVRQEGDLEIHRKPEAAGKIDLDDNT